MKSSEAHSTVQYYVQELKMLLLMFMRLQFPIRMIGSCRWIMLGWCQPHLSPGTWIRDRHKVQTDSSTGITSFMFYFFCS
jgi:hypothetical protein